MDDAKLRSQAISQTEWEGRVQLPPPDTSVPQDEEWCEVLEQQAWRRIRFHDYASIFERPGLYEYLFYSLLQCGSPGVVVGLLWDVRRRQRARLPPLRVIDLGAGNGIVAEDLRKVGAEKIVGIDILPEARDAALRDRPGVYTDFVVADLCDPSPEVSSRIRATRPNALVCVAALGFGDIPPRAYYNALDFVPEGGLLAFNIKEDFLDERYSHGFSELIRRMMAEKVVRVEATRRYRHRLSMAGEPILYTAMVATKLQPIPRAMLVEP